jgi:hypothetical protein
MEYFRKIPLDLSMVDMNLIRGGQPQEGYGDTYRSYHIRDMEYFLELCAARIRFKIPPDGVNYTEITDHGTVPHRDESKSALNYYVNTADAVTAFWEPKDPDYHGDVIARLDPDGKLRKSTAVSYDEKKLKIAGCFFARPHTAYLLRTSAIHSVKKFNSPHQRQFFRWMWRDLEFQDLLDNIEILTVD